MPESRLRRAAAAVRRAVSRLGVRLLAINVVVVFVPIFGIEFARLFERRLLHSLERDMTHQATIVGELLQLELARGVPLDDPGHAVIATRIARSTRARIRLLDPAGAVVVDSHAHGPPEGPERGSELGHRVDVASRRVDPRSYLADRWDDVAERREVLAARAGRPGAYTRIRDREPAVFLFVAQPVFVDARVAAIVYVTRSTTPVLDDLHRIRRSLGVLLGIALALTVGVTILLALSITRPLARLARTARRIARGERNVPIDRGGHGEIGELADAFATMTERLDERLTHSRDFAADVAHELKSPLTSIRGAAELLDEGAADDPVARARFLGNIRLDVDRLDRIVSRLLELGRIEAPITERVPVDLAVILRDVADRASTPDVAVALTIVDRPIVMLRAEDAEAALQNVIENAVRFSPLGVPVEVMLRVDRGTPVVTVTDHGPGIPESHRAKIFDRFFTTDAERDGTGLGLAIAKGAMQAHGGRIEVESREGETRFTMRFEGRAV